MTDDLSTTDARQLEAWAYGRQATGAEAERADAAQRELARRAEVERAEAVQAAVGQAAVGQAAVARADAVQAPAVPDADPLAIFERAPSETDAAWEARLTQDFIIAVTAGPRVIDVGDGLVGVAVRSAAVADGRSTAFDPYCLFTSEKAASGAPLSLSGACLTPDRFATEGNVLPVRPSAGGTGFDTVVWGPTGAPVLERERKLESIGGITIVLDWMVYPSFGDEEDPFAGIDDPDRLLMGPARVPFVVDDAVELGIAATAYVLEGETEAAGPVLCAAAATPGERQMTSCAPLEAMRRGGLTFLIIADERDWVVRIGADGPNHADTLRRAD